MIFFIGLITFFLVFKIDARQLKAADGSSMWIAEIEDTFDCTEMTEKIKTYSMSNRRVLHGDVIIDELRGDYDCFVSFNGNQAVADGVANMDGVVRVSPDEEVGIFWNRDRADQDNLPLDGAPYHPVFNGAGQCLYVIDTGIYPMHNDFTGRAKHGGDFINEDDADDGNGHGTHCASTAAGALYGIAPMTSEIYGVKVLGATGSGSSAGVIKGIQWAVTHANKNKKTCVLSLSLGGGENAALNKAAENAAKKHFVVVAAGNSNMDACSSSPASAVGNVITVGSTKKDDYRSSFSNYGKCVNIFGPGSDIESAYIGGKSNTKILSGTSMATPYIAGLALQSLQKNDGDYSLAYDDLLATATHGNVKNAGIGSPDLFGRAFDYTGPPTPPTTKPTMPPTTPDPKLCKLNPKADKFNICSDFAASKFGSHDWADVPITAPVLFSSVVPNLCEPSDQDFTGKIAVVDRGGCLFFTKVKNAETQGAVAVLIVQSKKVGIFNPGYYGTESTDLPSCMIPYKMGTNMLNDGDVVLWGPHMEDTMLPTTVPTTSSPTRKTKNPRPTGAPTLALRCDDTKTEKECGERTKCNWDGYVCYIRRKYQ